MQSKISPLAAVAAVVAFTAAPAFALDAHLVPVPSGAAAVESVEGVAGGEEAAAAAPDAGAAAALPAIPSGIPWPPRPPFPVPPAPPAAEAAADDTAAEVAASTNTLSTWCPEPTVFTWGSSTISVSAPTWVTLPLTDCPLSSTSSSSASSTETVSSIPNFCSLSQRKIIDTFCPRRLPLSSPTDVLTLTRTPDPRAASTRRATLPRSHRWLPSSRLRRPSPRSFPPTTSSSLVLPR
ncbi:hypothetical protein V8F20_012193, partial [Naviculisporaceae sp. PSN 640]